MQTTGISLLLALNLVIMPIAYVNVDSSLNEMNCPTLWYNYAVFENEELQEYYDYKRILKFEKTCISYLDCSNIAIGMPYPETLDGALFNGKDPLVDSIIGYFNDNCTDPQNMIKICNSIRYSGIDFGSEFYFDNCLDYQ